ncbi:MAG: DUF4111 domain-containing protein [Clostridia bacterium]|nr:DUF4111 domain-containing protein [Clostridia bacterium]
MDKRTDAILKRIQTLFEDVLGENLAGGYVHGSLAFGCFTWETGDIDLIIIAREEPSHEQKKRIIAGIIEIEKDGPPKGIEMSVLLEKDCRSFRHPMPYVLHYSKGHTEQYLRDMDGHINRLRGTDRDLAAHFTVMRAVGYPLTGPAVREMFPEVQRQDYFESIFYDIENAASEIHENPVYMILNLCRVLAYAEDGSVLSKKSGGEWGKANLPEAFASLAERALECYGSGKNCVFDAGLLERYADYMLENIRTAAGKAGK